MKIEPAQIADVPAIAALNRVFRVAAERSFLYDRQSWVEARIPDSFVIRDEKGIAAHSCLQHFSDHAELKIMVVREDCRRLGLGSALVKHAIEKASKAGAPEIRLGSGRRFGVKDFYLRHGFEIDERRTNDLNYRFIMRL